ncbi:MAG: hypothetical protein KDE50_12695 [Caldilineaceae bacterium]|nr:hypothetical protein [Caldilineaceae bacterium]
MINKNIAKFVIAVVLTLGITFSASLADNLLDTTITPQAHAECMGGGGSSGGGC